MKGNHSKSKDGWGIYDPRAPYNVSDVVYLNPSARRTWTTIDGLVWEDRAVGTTHRSRRPFYNTTRIQSIGDTSSHWRPPTRYVRTAYAQNTHELCSFRWGDSVCESSLDTALFVQSMTDGWQGPVKDFVYINPIYDWIGSDPELINDRSQAETEVLLKLKNQKVDFGTALAELTKTAAHLTTVATDLWRSVASARKGQWKEVFNILSKRSPLHSRKITAGKTLAQYWLEYQYAWRPLIGEAYGAYELFTEQAKPALLLHANRTIKRNKTISGRRYAGAWDGFWHELSATAKVRTIARVTARLDDGMIRQATRMGLINPAAVAWEVVPFSFVVDWSIPIGNVLQALDATNGLTFVGGSFTQQSLCKGTVKLSPRYSPVVGVREGESEVWKMVLDREVYSSFPMPSLYAKSPFSELHAASAVALLRQLF